jgi:hypothetical protein
MYDSVIQVHPSLPSSGGLTQLAAPTHKGHMLYDTCTLAHYGKLAKEPAAS